jgi:hypothetical protein
MHFIAGSPSHTMRHRDLAGYGAGEEESLRMIMIQTPIITSRQGAEYHTFLPRKLTHTASTLMTYL